MSHFTWGVYYINLLLADCWQTHTISHSLSVAQPNLELLRGVPRFSPSPTKPKKDILGLNYYV